MRPFQTGTKLDWRGARVRLDLLHVHHCGIWQVLTLKPNASQGHHDILILILKDSSRGAKHVTTSKPSECLPSVSPGLLSGYLRGVSAGLVCRTELLGLNALSNRVLAI